MNNQKVGYIAPVSEMRGKFVKKERYAGVILGKRNDTEARYFSYRKNFNGTDSPSASQQAVTAKFRSVAAAVKTVMADPAQLEPYRAGWKAHVKSGATSHLTLRGYIFWQIWLTGEV